MPGHPAHGDPALAAAFAGAGLQGFPLIDHALNLEFVLPQLQPDYVLAGVCGALPVVRRLRVGRPVVLSELLDMSLHEHGVEKRAVLAYLGDVEVW